MTALFLVEPYKEIILSNGAVALVDDNKYEEIAQYTWFPHYSHNKVRAQRKMRRGKSSIFMHHEVLELYDKKHVIVKHLNGDLLDNRLANLRVVARNLLPKSLPRIKINSKDLAETISKIERIVSTAMHSEVGVLKSQRLKTAWMIQDVVCSIMSKTTSEVAEELQQILSELALKL